MKLKVKTPDDWLSRGELEGLTPAILKERMIALKPLIAKNARQAEIDRKPSDEVWNALRKSGIFYHLIPKAYGGLEFDIESFIDVMLPVGEACASTCWVATFCMEHNWQVSLLSNAAQDEIFGAFPYVIAPGVVNPPGKAVAVEGGYRISGRWKWGTGIMHADWILANVLIEGEKTVPYVCALPADEAEIVDIWHVDGMSATGSNDIVLEDVFVPSHRVCLGLSARDFFAPGDVLHANPLYHVPASSFLALTAAIASVGAARGAVAHFRERLSERSIYGSQSKYTEKVPAQMRLAHGEMQARAAEKLLYDAGRQMISLAQRGYCASVPERLALRMQIAYVVDMARQAVRLVCEGAGSSAHFLDSPLQRAFRDLNMMATHVIFDIDTAAEQHGRALLGLPPTTMLI